MRHMATGEHALVQRLPDGLCLAQFDRLDHPQSHGWHLHLRREFRVARYRAMRSPRFRVFDEIGTVTPEQVLTATGRRPRPPEMQRMP